MLAEELKIVSARITAMPNSLFDAMPKVYVTLENGIEEYLFDFYPDEISFTPQEFVGLTTSQAKTLKYNKDIAYLRS
jgi:hypothetical protein